MAKPVLRAREDEDGERVGAARSRGALQVEAKLARRGYAMNGSKLSGSLLRLLEHAAGCGEHVQIVLELCPLRVLETHMTSRAERIASAREAFFRDAVPVEVAIRAAGGEVLGRAWSNRTLLARIPTDLVVGLAALDQVVLLDLPRRGEPQPHSGRD